MQGCPKPCDARRGDAARLLIFPITGVGFSEMPPRSQISPPLLLSFCLSVQQPSSPGAVTHRASPRHPGAGRGCRSLAQPQGPPVQPAGGGTELLRSHRARADASGPRCCYKPEDAAVPGMEGEDPTTGMGCALPNGRPRVPQGLGAAPSPLRWPLPCACPLGSGLPGSPAPGPPPRLRFITRRGVSSGEAPPGLCGGLCFVVCVCQRARHGRPCPLLRSELRPPPLAGGTLHPKGHGAADGVVQGKGPAPRGSQGTVLWASPPTAVPAWDGVAGTAAGRTCWGSQFPFLWVFSSIPWCLPASGMALPVMPRHGGG